MIIILPFLLNAISGLFSCCLENPLGPIYMAIVNQTPDVQL